jgi:hypothetical protein
VRRFDPLHGGEFLRSSWTMGQLDCRLQRLEDASEKGETVVSSPLARLVGQGLPSIEAGMPLTDALEAVFQEQEKLMSGRSSGLRPNSDVRRLRVWARAPIRTTTKSASQSRLPESDALMDHPQSTLDTRAAEVLTQRIKTELSNVCLLLAEAHDRQAWAALGYATWEQYVRDEFGYSRSRSYEILDQARVVQALQQAVGSTSIPDISPYAARQIKAYLPEVVDEIRYRVAAVASSNECAGIVRQVVAGARSRATLSVHRTSPATRTGRADTSISYHEFAEVFVALDFLAKLPPPSDDLLVALKKEPQQLHSLQAAINWLLRLAKCAELELPLSRPVDEGYAVVAAVIHPSGPQALHSTQRAVSRNTSAITDSVISDHERTSTGVRC